MDPTSPYPIFNDFLPSCMDVTLCLVGWDGDWGRNVRFIEYTQNSLSWALPLLGILTGAGR